MSSQTQLNDPELEKLLTKAFDDLRKRIHTYMQRKEKKLVKELKSTKPITNKKEKEHAHSAHGSKKHSGSGKNRPKEDYRVSSSGSETD